MKLLFVLITLSLASALDVELTGVQCDSSLPVSAEIILECDGSSRCTFNKAASVYGTSKSTRERYIIRHAEHQAFLTLNPIPLFLSDLQWS
jgi:hypothetical protein